MPTNRAFGFRMWIENGSRRRPPPKPDRRFSRIRLSGSWSLMNWLRHSTQGFQKSRTSRARLRPAHLGCRRFTVGSIWASRPGGASGRTALRHYPDPCGMDTPQLPTPRPYPPSLRGRYSLLRYYEGSDPDRSFRRRPWFPDSRHSNFRAFHLQSSAGLPQSRSTPSALAALFCYGLRRGYAGSPVPPTESSSLCSLYRESLLRTARSFPVALHSGLSPRRSYFQLPRKRELVGTSRCDVPAPYRRGTRLRQRWETALFISPAERGRRPRSARSLPCFGAGQLRFSGLLAFQYRPGQGLSPCRSSTLSGAHSPGLSPYRASAR